MSELVGAYIKTIVSFLLISVFVEIISPDGYKKYLKLLMGIMLTMAVLQPIIRFVGWSSDELQGVVDRKTEEIFNTNDYDFVVDDKELYISLFKEKLKESILNDAKAENVEIVINEKEENFGEILEIKLFKAEKGDDDERDIAYLAGRYGISPENIEFIYQ